MTAPVVAVLFGLEGFDTQVPEADNRTYNVPLRGLRSLGERGFALLTQRWGTLCAASPPAPLPSFTDNRFGWMFERGVHADAGVVVAAVSQRGQATCGSCVQGGQDVFAGGGEKRCRV